MVERRSEEHLGRPGAHVVECLASVALGFMVKHGHDAQRDLEEPYVARYSNGLDC